MFQSTPGSAHTQVQLLNSCSAALSIVQSRPNDELTCRVTRSLALFMLPLLLPLLLPVLLPLLRYCKICGRSQDGHGSDGRSNGDPFELQPPESVSRASGS